LAAAYIDIGRFADAEPMLRKALSIHERALGTDHDNVATARSAWGYVLYGNCVLCGACASQRFIRRHTGATITGSRGRPSLKKAVLEKTISDRSVCGRFPPLSSKGSCWTCG